eukprot:2341712-Amphidinium_carterae.1
MPCIHSINLSGRLLLLRNFRGQDSAACCFLHALASANSWLENSQGVAVVARQATHLVAVLGNWQTFAIQMCAPSVLVAYGLTSTFHEHR